MKKILYFVLFGAVLFTTSCADLLEENPPHLYTRDRVYTTVQGFQLGLNGLYGLMRTERDCSRFISEQYWGDFSGAAAFGATDDYLCAQTGTQGNLVKNPSQYLLPTQTAVRNLFAWYYVIINSANTLLEDADSEDMDWGDQAALRERIMGEALVARAWAYRQLVYYWGPVPLKLDASDGSEIRTDFVRASEEEVQQQMVKDLEIAAEYIPWVPNAAGSMTKGVALHYLAETYLALGKRALDEGRSEDSQNYYSEAERYASIVIGDGAISAEDTERFGVSNRSLMPDFNAMFDPSMVDYGVNSETLWTWQWGISAVGGGANAMRYAFVTYYTRARNGFGSTRDYDGNISPYQSEERGGQGWCELAITPRVMELYYNSSSTEALPDKTNEAALKAFWNAFEYEDRGSDKALRKYFLLDKDKDLMTNPDKLNPSTGKAWATRDTVWVMATQNADASRRYEAMGMDFRNMTYNRYRYVYTMKYAYCDPGRNMETDTHYNQMYLRLAETILLRAEARVFLGNLAGAADDINMLRGRANALPVFAGDFGDDLISQVDFVLDERTRELLCEEQRRFTLTRLGRKDFLWRRSYKYNDTDRATIESQKQAIYFPIPQSVIDANLTLPMEQNPGYSGVPLDPTGWPEVEIWTMPN